MLAARAHRLGAAAARAARRQPGPPPLQQQLAVVVAARCCCSSSSAAAEPANATTASSTQQACFLAPSEAHLTHLASLLAAQRSAGDVLCLRGAVGAGKSAFSRGFIRAAAGDPELPVPSPTYLLQIIYDEQEGPPIHHFDLYRLQQQDNLARLDLGASYSSAVVLLEWAERLPPELLPAQRLEVTLTALAPNSSSSSGSSSSSEAASLQQHHQQQPHGDLPAAQVIPLPDAGKDGSCESDCDVAGASHDAGDEEEAEADDDDDPYTDRRWRHVQLTAVGPAWQPRLAALVASLAAGAGAGD